MALDREKNGNDKEEVAVASSNLPNVRFEGMASEDCDFDSPRSHGSGMSRYRRGLLNLLPVRCQKSPPGVVPLEANGLLDYMTFGWLTPYMWEVFRRGTSGLRSLRMSHEERAEIGAQRLAEIWQTELKEKGPGEASYGKVIFKAFKTRLLIGTFISLIYAFLSLANPMLVIHYFLKYLSEETVTIETGIVYAVILALIVLLRALTGGAFWMLNYEAAARIKYGSLALLYRKVLHLKTLGDKTVGDMVNFISNDGQRIWDGVLMSPFIIGGPMILIMSCVYSIVYLGPWALIAWLVVIGFYPVMISFAKLSQKLRRQCITVTDKRVGLMSELLTCIKLIKMYAWEQSFSKRIAELRGTEKSILEKSDFVMSLSVGSSIMVPLFASCLTFIGYVASGNDLTPVKAFTFVSLLNAMQVSLSTVPFALKCFSELIVSAQRMKDILLLEELKYDFKAPSNNSSAVEIVNANFSWVARQTKSTKIDNNHIDKSTNNMKKKRRRKKKEAKENGKHEEEKIQLNHEEKDTNNQIYVGPTLHSITFTLKKGHLVGVCGHVGCGKSSLINAILGKMDLTSGSVALTGQAAYVPQQPWVMNDTVRGNILFGNEFDPDRYRQVLDACGLQPDIDSFPMGDGTEVGERGVTLSGGQKQRISLARAAYSKSDLILLDDPLSAVDIQLGQHIFKLCVRGMLKGRTTLLVTHHIQYLQHCDEIVVMKEGSVTQQGSHDSLATVNGEYANLLSHYIKEKERREEEEKKRQQKERNDEQADLGEEGTSEKRNQEEISETVIENNNKTLLVASDDTEVQKALLEDKDKVVDPGLESSGQLIQEEEMDTGALKLSVLHQYLKAAGGYIVAFLVFICFSLPVASGTAASWYLKYWLEQGGGGANVTSTDNQTIPSASVLDNPRKETYLLLYAMFIPLLIVTMVLRSFFLIKTTLRASTKLHDQGFKQILRCSMKFFDTTPVGRIVNRFSADLDEIDVRLPLNMEIFLNNVLQTLAALAVIGYVLPWFLTAIVPLGIFFFFLMIVFHTCIRELKRWDNVSRSPVLSHMATSVQGLTSIQAYHRTKQFVKRHCELLNANNVAVFMFNSANRWLAVRLDLVSAAVAFLTGVLILVTFDIMNPAMAGLALSYSVQMSGLFQFLARLAVETEARFTSVERVLHYCNISDKESPTVKGDVQADKGWPRSGVITFNNVQMRYRSGLPLALRGVTFKLDSQHKLGIVGRSGAGKSSLAVAMFRLVELEAGSISIDNLDIGKVPLEDLRSKISIIPQDPVLFSGTIRYNLDPLSQCSDADIWQALDKCHIANLVKSLDHQLDTQVVEGGENFSVGERQLLCMARALLRNSKILVLDEATAAIDPETDGLIQKTLKEAFQSCSMLIIAHRLNTVLGCDRIMVLEEGQILEFDSPSNLLANSKSKFKVMLDASEGGRNLSS